MSGGSAHPAHPRAPAVGDADWVEETRRSIAREREEMALRRQRAEERKRECRR